MPSPKPPRVKTLADFRASHDLSVIIPNKIRKALEHIAAQGAENWEYEVDLVRIADVNTTQLAMYREQFLEHVVETAARHQASRRRVWFGTTKAAAKARGE